MADGNIWEEDIEWLKIQCRAEHLPEPNENEEDYFAQRVAEIWLENGGYDEAARMKGFELHKSRLGKSWRRKDEY